jgi:hypothetical protein
MAACCAGITLDSAYRVADATAASTDALGAGVIFAR